MSSAECEDLTQEATLEALKAMERFDPERGVELESYMRWAVGLRVSDLVQELRSGGITGKYDESSLVDETVEQPELAELERVAPQEKIDAAIDIDAMLTGLEPGDRELLESIYGLDTGDPESLRQLAARYETTIWSIRSKVAEIIEKVRGGRTAA